LDNAAIARVLREIADLLEIKGDNPFKIRAYRNGADIVANHPHTLAALAPPELREIPGIGKDLATRIREVAETGGCTYHRELLAEFPATILDLLHLQGVGPKTVAMLYRELGVRTVEDLERAAATGAVRALRGMGTKKEASILKALHERKQHVGRRLLPEAHTTAAALVAHLREFAPATEVTPVGSLRRGCETCGDVDLLAAGADRSLMDTFLAYGDVERVLARGETKTSVLLSGGFQADLRLVPAESRGAALQYFTGSKAHNIALRDRALTRGLKLNEYGLYRGEADRLVGRTEEEIYGALDLEWITPELREGRGEIEAAEAGRLPRLVRDADIRGDLHIHTIETDGKDTVTAMAAAARDRGLEYIAITEHSRSLVMANGLDERRALAHAARIRVEDRQQGVRLLAGIECDIRLDGTLDLDDECLAALDLVVASVHAGFHQDRQQMTERLLRAIENPHVDVLGHPTGRMLLRREPYSLDVEAVVESAARHGVALEINGQPPRLDLSEVNARLAHDRGARLVISTDAHSRAELDAMRWGVTIARRAWLEPGDILNTLPFEAFRANLRRHRGAPTPAIRS
jgi:DNA polymerase (family 10)